MSQSQFLLNQFRAAGDSLFCLHLLAQISDAHSNFLRLQQPFQTETQGIGGDILWQESQSPTLTLEMGGIFKLIKPAQDDHGRDAVVAGGLGSADAALVDNRVHEGKEHGVGGIGLNEADAVQCGKRVKITKLPMTYVARAIEIDETRGFMKAIVDADTEQILGATVLGLEGGEIMAMLEIAMLGKLPYTVLRDAIIAHPTLAESLNYLFMTLG